MRRAMVLALLFFCIVLSMPMAFALDNLPEFKLPTLPPLETPTLSKNYSDMLKELEQQGWGKYKYSPQDPLPLPDVEVPVGTGKKATEKFLEEFGDMWNSPERQLDRGSSVPEDAYFKDFLEKYKNEKLAEFEGIKSKENVSMDEFLKSQLDMSGLWNLEELKKQIQFQDTKKLLSNVPKPEGWDAVKKSSSVVPNMDSWLNSGPKASGYGRTVLDIGLDSLKSIFPNFNLDNLKEKLLGGIQNIRKAVDDAAKAAKEEMQKMGQLSEETRNKLKELGIKESLQFIPFFHGK